MRKEPYSEKQKLKQISILLQRALEYDGDNDQWRECIEEALEVINCTGQQQSKSTYQLKNTPVKKQYADGMTREDVKLWVRNVCESGTVSGVDDDELEAALDTISTEKGAMTINHVWEQLESKLTFDAQFITAETPSPLDTNDLEGVHMLKHFEDGKPVKGVVTYRVVYEDNDTETLDLNEIVRHNMRFNGQTLGINGTDRFVMELFSGELVFVVLVFYPSFYFIIYY